MTLQLLGIRVFIASPGGLAEERDLIRSEIDRFNIETAHHDGKCFIPVGWEDRSSSVGRPQGLINKDLQESDYTLVLLWDRWGSPTAADDSGYTAGVEEEYAMAKEAMGDVDLPMRDIAVLFKSVDERQLSDPGDSLKKVIAFRQALQESKTLLFTVFDGTDGLATEVRKQLSRWMREVDIDKEAKGEPPTLSSLEEPDTPTSSLTAARDFARKGLLSEAEGEFSSLLTENATGEVLAEYAKFLRRAGRFSQATRVADRLLQKARQDKDYLLMVDAYSSLGVIARKRGDLPGAVDYFDTAAVLYDELDFEDPAVVRVVTYALDNQGHTLRRLGRLDEASEAFNQSSTLRRNADDKHGLASSLNNLGIVQRENGDPAAARKSHEQALKIFKELDDERSIAITSSAIGSTDEDEGDLKAAELAYRTALEEAVRLGDVGTESINLGKLAHVLTEQKELGDATTTAFRFLELSERVGNEEGVARALLILGRVYRLRTDWDSALDSVEQALARYQRIQHISGSVLSLLELAMLCAETDQPREAEQALKEAELLVETNPTPLMIEKVGLAREAVRS